MTGIIIFLLILIIFVSPFYFFVKFIKNKKEKQKSSFWKGKLVYKDHLEYEDDDSSYTKDLYTLYFETTKGQKIKMHVVKKAYDEWKIGDKAQKIQGKLLPEKL